MLFMAARSAGVTPAPNENVKCISSRAFPDQPCGESSVGRATRLHSFLVPGVDACGPGLAVRCDLWRLLPGGSGCISQKDKLGCWPELTIFYAALPRQSGLGCVPDSGDDSRGDKSVADRHAIPSSRTNDTTEFLEVLPWQPPVRAFARARAWLSNTCNAYTKKGITLLNEAINQLKSSPVTAADRYLCLSVHHFIRQRLQCAVMA